MSTFRSAGSIVSPPPSCRLSVYGTAGTDLNGVNFPIVFTFGRFRLLFTCTCKYSDKPSFYIIRFYIIRLQSYTVSFILPFSRWCEEPSVCKIGTVAVALYLSSV